MRRDPGWVMPLPQAVHTVWLWPLGGFFHVQQATGSSSEKNKAQNRAGSDPGQSLIPWSQSFQHKWSLVLSPRGDSEVHARSRGCICVFCSGVEKATRGKGVIGAEGWKGKWQTSSTGSARRP